LNIDLTYKEVDLLLAFIKLHLSIIDSAKTTWRGNKSAMVHFNQREQTLLLLRARLHSALAELDLQIKADIPVDGKQD
jgi:hypothetical protein